MTADEEGNPIPLVEKKKIMQPLFHEAVARMVATFEKRATALYGEPKTDPSPQKA